MKKHTSKMCTPQINTEQRAHVRLAGFYVTWQALMASSTLSGLAVTVIRYQLPSNRSKLHRGEKKTAMQTHKKTRTRAKEGGGGGYTRRWTKAIVGQALTKQKQTNKKKDSKLRCTRKIEQIQVTYNRVHTHRP